MPPVPQQPPSPGAPTLILVPTPLELAQLEGLGGFPAGAGLLERCGFGPVAAAARTAQLVARLAPRRVLLLGIAGSFDLERLAPGSATCFDAVALDGVGAGAGAGFVSASDLGFPQWQDGDGDVAEVLPLAATPRTAPGTAPGALLLSVCAASADAAQAKARRARYPQALAEDMEAFGVALACRLARVPLAVVRGISNAVGERDASAWCIGAALAAARECAREALESASPWEPPA